MHKSLPLTLTVLANPWAGRPREPEEAVLEAFRATGIEARVLRLGPVELREAAKQAVREEVPVLGVYGGDGTHSLAASALTGSATALAPLPGGTVNTFARRLGILDLGTAARAVASGRWRSVPLGRVGGSTFVSTATFGEYARVVRRREGLRRWLPKWPAAAVAFLLTVVHPRHLEIDVELDGVELRRRTSLVWVGIGYGSFPLPQRAPPVEGKPQLEVAVLRPGSRVHMAALLLRLPLRILAGETAREDGAFEILHSPRLRLGSRHHIGVTLDGEPLALAPPAEVRVARESLRVVGEG